MTKKEASKLLNVKEDITYGLLRFLVDVNLAEIVKTEKASGKKGKPPTIYKLKPTAHKEITNILEKLINPPDNRKVLITPFIIPNTPIEAPKISCRNSDEEESAEKIASRYS